MNNFIDSLGLSVDFSNSNRIQLKSSNEYSSVYNELALNDSLQEVDQEVTSVKSRFTYTNGEYEVTISANFDNDKYFIEVSER